MDESVARRTFMEQQFERLGYPHTRIVAYTPATSPLIKKPPKCKRSPKDYACIASHLKAFRTALKDCSVNNSSESDFFMIMEDDTVIPFQVDWSALLKTAPRKWEILQLFVINKNVVTRLYKNRYKKGKMWHPWSVKHFSAGIYLIKKSAAQSLLNSFWHSDILDNDILDFSQLRYPVVIDELLYRSVNTHSLTYPTFFSNIALGSTVHPDHVKRHAKCVSSILEIHKYKDEPYFLHQLSPTQIPDYKLAYK